MSSVAVGFDFDGTLVDSFGAIADAARRAALEVRVELPPHAELALSALSLEDYGQVISFQDDAQFMRFKAAFRAVFDRESYQAVTCLPGAHEALHECAAAFGGDRVFILTNRRLDSVLQIIAHLGIQPPLGGVHSCASGSPKGNRKVDKLRPLVQRYRTGGSATVAYVGDAEADVEAALACGAVAVLCAQNQAKPARAQTGILVVSALHEVVPLLNKEHP